ncbi:MAG TPA: UTP--glucose-1-phosphate uridylyltransferase GalU [Terriglobia bacterium]|nr:UTP--glucose-1-phosphate uridylyltransferase GalU [Terriglobia bacterium]
MRIRKAVLPVAGLGTRFLPATKAQPKEMLPIVDKPLVQYAVEEVAASDIPMVVFVTGRGKQAIENHFDLSAELEQELAGRGKEELRRQLRNISGMLRFAYVRQQIPKGLGDAILTARNVVEDEPFAVVLSDDVIVNEIPCLKQMLAVYDRFGRSVIAIQRVPRKAVSSYGVIRGHLVPDREFHGRLYQIADMVEKPSPSEAPSNLAVIGRYILTPAIWNALSSVVPGAGGEIQLTDGLRRLLATEPVYGYVFEGKRYDAGDKLGFLQATVEIALARPDLGLAFRKYLRSLNV